ncbi:MAG: double-cubane-cluster-containing anaerobic reductase [Lachnospiraceae bacterium]|nr:double-cubane-cluster-containing anaerobic reductase [Lachnospiraceae bacterium]
MKLINDLPKVFDEFAQQRKNSFLAVKKIKESGKPVVGVFCTYLPQEIPAAMGAAVVGLCSTSDETVSDAEKDLPRNLCPLIKSSYGFAKTDKCPFFYFSDLIVGETTCDGKKKMYEYLGEFKPVHVMQLPNTQNEDGYEMYRREIIRFKEKLEELFQTVITEEDIRKAIVQRNRERQALKDLYGLMKADPLPMKGSDLFHILYGSTFKFDKEQVITELQGIRKQIQSEYEQGKRLKKMPRILITGSPIGGGAFKVVNLIEENGGAVVAFENCAGAKSIEEFVDEKDPDVYGALARRYLNIGCSCMSPNPNRFELLGKLIEEYRADAVVEVVLTACHTYNVETYGVKRFVTEKYGIPYMTVETDYSSGDMGQLNTRIAAFLEML